MLPSPLHRPPRRGRVLALVLTLAAVTLTAWGCEDLVTRPTPPAPVSVADPEAPPPFAVTGSVEGDISGSYPVPMASSDWVEGSAAIGTTSSSGQLYKVTVRGQLERIGLYNGAPHGSVPYTAYGAFACWGGVNVWYNTNGNLWNGSCTGTNGSTTEVRYAKLYNNVWATRTQGDQSGGCGWDSVDRFNLCYTFRDAEPYQVTLERVKAKLVVTPGFAALKAGQSVTFTLSVAATEDAAAPASITPFTVQGWTFTPDGGTAAPRSCYLTCAMTPSQSGWLKVTGVANGEPQEVNVRIKVYTNFTLIADSSTAHVGSTVTFQPYLDGEQVVANGGWKWSLDGVVASTLCRDTDSACKHPMSVKGNGRMWAYILRADNSRDSASADVAVKDTVPCPTGDPIMDDPEVRASLERELQKSRLDLPVHQRREQAGYIIRNPDGSLSLEPVDFNIPGNTDVSGPCSFRHTFVPRPEVVGIYHTHPGTPGEVGRCNDTTYRDPLTGKPEEPHTYLPHWQGGGSWGDWDQLEDYNKRRQAAGLPPVNSYIIDTENFYRLPSGVSAGPFPGDKEKFRQHYRFTPKRPTQCPAPW